MLFLFSLIQFYLLMLCLNYNRYFKKVKVYLNNFLWRKDLEVSMAIFFPSLVRKKEVLGSPVINFLFLRVRRGRSSFRESGHSGFLEKQNASGNILKLSLTNLSKVHFSPLLTIEYIPKRINSLIPRFLYDSLSKYFSIFISQKLLRGQDRLSFPVLKSFSVFPRNFPFLFGNRQKGRFCHEHLQIGCRR